MVTATLLEKLLVAEELQRLDSMKSEFIAIASHELRTPLTSVYGISLTLDERGDALSAGERRQLRRTLREQAERLRTLVDQLLDLSRFDVAVVEISPTSMPLATKLHELVELLAPDQQVAIDIDPQLTGWVDPVALDRIVSNLLSNALRYGRLPITISATGGETYLRLAVEDRGAGVADDFVPRLFERFSRSENSMRARCGLRSRARHRPRLRPRPRRRPRVRARAADRRTLRRHASDKTARAARSVAGS